MKLQSTSEKFDARNVGALCDECPLNSCLPVPISPANPNAKLIVLQDQPSSWDTKTNQHLSGSTGDAFNGILTRIGASRSSLHITSAVLCRSPEKLDPKQSRKALDCCRPRVKSEFDSLRADLPVLTLGGLSLQTLTGKAKYIDWMGAPIPGEIVGTRESKVDFSNHQILPTFRFTEIYEKPALLPALTIHIGRAWDLANGNLPAWNWPPIAIEDAQQFSDFASLIHADNEPIAVDVETTGIDPFTAELLNIGFANTHRAISYSILDATPDQIHDILELLLSPIPKTMHNGQYDICSLESHGFKVANFDFDTIAASAIIAPQLPRNLSFLTSLEFHAPRWKTVFRKIGDDAGANRFLKADWRDRALYNAKDCIMTAHLRIRQERRLKTIHNGQAQMDRYMELIQIAIHMRQAGISIDHAQVKIQREILSQQLESAKSAFRVLASALGISEIEPNNLAQCHLLFFMKLGAPILKRSAKTKRPSLDADTLTSYLGYPNDSLRSCAQELLKYRRATKYLKTYVEVYAQKTKLNPTWNPFGARTGRWSSQDPNFMNIPKPLRSLFSAN